MLSERNQKHEACWTMPWGPVRGAPGKKAEGPLPRVHVVPWIALDVIPRLLQQTFAYNL